MFGGQGTGLGLAISRDIVESNNGRIALNPKDEGGTVVTVILPQSTQAPSPSEPIDDAEPPSDSAAGRLLVIDDEPRFTKSLSALLDEAHDVRTVGSGEEALELLSSDSEFDVILCDLMMDDLSGQDVYREVRERSPGLEERITFITGGAFTESAREFVDSVPNKCLNKPVSWQEIDKLVRETKGGNRRSAD